jgi:hypothetical protein
MASVSSAGATAPAAWCSTPRWRFQSIGLRGKNLREKIAKKENNIKK